MNIIILNYAVKVLIFFSSYSLIYSFIPFLGCVGILAFLFRKEIERIMKRRKFLKEVKPAKNNNESEKSSQFRQNYSLLKVFMDFLKHKPEDGELKELDVEAVQKIKELMG